MKRVGNLMERIAHPDNLREAFLRAARGKQCRPTVRQFRAKLDANLAAMRQQLLGGEFCFGDYRFFTVFDPKRREICAAAFPERVAQHAMMRICHPVFDAYQSPDSYASRLGRGTYAALDLAVQLSRRHAWFAKLRQLTAAECHGGITQEEFSMRAGCLLAFIDKAAAQGFRKAVMQRQGMCPQGLQPREPWRQLEQQRQELPRVEPQQQHAVEHEQQPRLAPRSLAPPRNERKEGHPIFGVIDLELLAKRYLADKSCEMAFQCG